MNNTDTIKLKELSKLVKHFDRKTSKFLKKFKKNAKKGDKEKAFINLLIACLRSSPRWTIKGYELIISVLKPEEKLQLPDYKDLPAIINEILIFRCFLIDVTLWGVIAENIGHQYNYSSTLLREKTNEIMDEIFDGALQISYEFNELIGTHAKPQDFIKLYDSKFEEYSKMDFNNSQSPKGTLFWEACKQITISIIGGQDFVLITYLSQLAYQDYISNIEMAETVYKKK